MFIVEFYETKDGKSEVWDFLECLRIKSVNNKDLRIQYKQISLYIQLLQDHGTRLPDNITKHIVDDIWELRPGHNRILYFYYKDNVFVLLHSFRKQTKQTPIREIKIAKKYRDDYLLRKG